MGQGDGEHLVGANAGVVARAAGVRLSVDDVIEAAGGGIPEATVERLTEANGPGGDGLGAKADWASAPIVLLRRLQPARKQYEGVVEEGVDLDGLSPAGCHHPVAHLGVHPGELID